MNKEWTTIASAFERRMLRWAFKQLGCTYVWQGKGDMRFDVLKGLRPWRADELMGPGRSCYDCSGLVACALFHVSNFDIRARWNSGLILEATRPYESREFFHSQLRFYGVNNIVSHIAFAFPSRGVWDESVMLLEAAGAGSDAINEATGIQKGACVRFAEEGSARAGQLISWAPLWSLGVAANVVPKP